ncbi:Phosphoinositide 3-kinase adapter protein 1 [Camelus dromedarius]|uniref:Phosphoinositide 3-kinase adapter protein 1 n=1 Tax=Camelus dromedarius TaxID=9838 RepID=A0A5N4DKE1_CAMDR|nr:Phosphoinositide 3-kinase adapter protein 1 [Camelus dromedarius]
MASLERDTHRLGQEEEDVYHTVDDDEAFSVDLASRPPFLQKKAKSGLGIYMFLQRASGKRQLITLQEQVKLGIVNVDEAVLHFKEWQLNQKKRSESFRFQQENLKRLRDSITRRQREKQKSGKQTDLEITVPIRHSQHLPGKVDFGVYESGPRKSVFPPRTELRRGDWKTDSTSSTASSASNRSSTRSLLSVSSGMEGDNEDNEVPEVTRSRSPGPPQVDNAPTVPLERPPRVPPRAASQR